MKFSYHQFWFQRYYKNPIRMAAILKSKMANANIIINGFSKYSMKSFINAFESAILDFKDGRHSLILFCWYLSNYNWYKETFKVYPMFLGAMNSMKPFSNEFESATLNFKMATINSISCSFILHNIDDIYGKYDGWKHIFNVLPCFIGSHIQWKPVETDWVSHLRFQDGGHDKCHFASADPKTVSMFCPCLVYLWN